MWNRHSSKLNEWTTGTQQELEDLRTRVAAYENSNRIELERYEVLKKRFMNMLVRHYLEVQKFNKACENQSKMPVLYFYTNEGCEECQDQGKVLAEINQAENNVVVFPLDSSLEMRHIEFLEDIHGIEEYPAVVIGDQTFEGFMTMEQVSARIEEVKSGQNS